MKFNLLERGGEMFTCCECDNEFDEPRLFIETHGLDTPPYEKYYGCPYCSGDYEDYKEQQYDDGKCRLF